MTGSRPMVRDGSVSFSLLELARLEEERVREEAETLRHAREVELARERALREQAVRSALLAEAAQAAEEERRRERDARLEAMQRAVVERAKAEAEERALAEDRERARQHELMLAQARRDPWLRRYKRLATAAGVLAAVSCAANALVYASMVRPQAERRVADATEKASQSERTVSLLRARGEEDARAIAALRADIEHARREAATARSDLEEARGQVERLGALRTHGVVLHPPPPLHPTTGALSDECAGSHDPLCGLKH